MEAFAQSLTLLSIVVSMSVCAVLIARIYRKNAALDPKITNKLRKQQEEYISEVERKNRSLQNKLNSMQKGPELSEMGDLDGVLPELLGQVEGILPKWATKFLKSNPDIVNSVVSYAKENPDKAKELIGKFVKIKPKTSSPDNATLQGL
jgi:hypothetical protein|tara:strand:- start:210 stop:656 length:447 start_codon:yes stop_codon:yes gene_type:complete